MAKQTLFHILSRQPWWVTLLVALVMFALARILYEPIAPFVAVPFVLFGIFIGFKQFRSGSSADAGERLTALREMSWDEFSRLVTDAYRREGYTVAPADGAGHDFKLTNNGRLTLLQCRRWKVSQVGAGPVRELAAAVDRNEAYNGICIGGNAFSAPALELAKQEPIKLVAGLELAQLVRSVQKKKRGRLWISVRALECASPRIDRRQT